MKHKTGSRNVIVTVPRYGTLPPPPDVLRTAQKLMEKSGKIFKSNDNIDPHSAEGESVDNASEWNSMLITARTQRGPQWDVASQLFQVDKESPLYYDHGPLAVGEPDPDNGDGQGLPSQGHTPSGHSFNSPPPSFRRTPSQGDHLHSGYNTNPATPSPVPTRSEMPPPSTRRSTRNSGRDNGF